MAKRIKRKGKASRSMPVLHADAAGIDIGAEEIFVAVPPDQASEPVRSFGSFTADLNELADWLESCRIRTVAMESTGVYWIPLYQILETRGCHLIYLTLFQPLTQPFQIRCKRSERGRLLSRVIPIGDLDAGTHGLLVHVQTRTPTVYDFHNDLLRRERGAVER